MNRGTVLVTGSAGHLGDGLVRVLRAEGTEVVGLDVLDSPSTTVVGSITDRGAVRRCLSGVDAVVHAATLHQPHIASHDRQAFVDTNVTGTLVLLEESVAAGVERFIFTSTTSTFGRALTPPPGAPAVWITEDVTPVPRNVYGVTKTAAEDLCQLVHRAHQLPVIVLRVSRLFPEGSDSDDAQAFYADANVKANEFLYRRIDIEDVVSAHLAALDRAPEIGFGRYIISATTPFRRADVAALVVDAPGVVRRLFPEQEVLYARRDWKMFPGIDRVYVNARARTELGWAPRYDFRSVLDRLTVDEDTRSPLARAVGTKGYHLVTGPGTDAFGRALLDWSQGGTDPEIIERDDGFWEFGAGHELYQAPFPAWLAAERGSVRYVRGRVIDVGCGGGRVALHLQKRGFDVVGLDSSPLAVRAARRRGVHQVWRLSLDDLAPKIGAFDTIVLFGNNFGVFGTPDRLRRVLSEWARRTPPGARILAGSTNPYCGGAPALTRSYYFENRRAGRLPGQVRLRVRYRRSVTSWFDWLFVSRQEMRDLLQGTGWHQRRIVGGPSSEPYVAVLEKNASHT